MKLGHVLQQTTGTSQLVEGCIKVIKIKLALGNAFEHVLKGDTFHFRNQLAYRHALHFQGLGNLVAKPGVLHLGIKERKLFERLAGNRSDIAQLTNNLNTFIRCRTH